MIGGADECSKSADLARPYSGQSISHSRLCDQALFVRLPYAHIGRKQPAIEFEQPRIRYDRRRRTGTQECHVEAVGHRHRHWSYMR